MENIKGIDMMMEKAAANEIELNGGESVIIRNYRYTKKYLNTEHIVIDDIVWEDDQKDFLDTLRKLDINKIIITNTSTALMGLIYFLINEGCVIEGTILIEGEFGEDKKGLLMKVN